MPMINAAKNGDLAEMTAVSTIKTKANSKATLLQMNFDFRHMPVIENEMERIIKHFICARLLKIGICRGFVVVVIAIYTEYVLYRTDPKCDGL
jgi:hypothetical protein